MRDEPIEIPPPTDDKSAVYRRLTRQVKAIGRRRLASMRGGRAHLRPHHRSPALLGLVREQVFAALLGAGLYADAFQVAFRIPNLLRDLFAEGALSAAFVPTYARALARGRPGAGPPLASRLLTLLAVVLGALVVLGLVFAGPLVRAPGPRLRPVPGKTELDRPAHARDAALPAPRLLRRGGHGDAQRAGALRRRRRSAPAMFNLVTIAWAAGLWAMGFGPAQVAIGWAIGTLLGGRRAVPRSRCRRSGRDGLALPAGMGAAAIPGIRAIGRAHGAGHGGPGRGAGEHLREHDLRVARARARCPGCSTRSASSTCRSASSASRVGTVATTGLARRAAAGDIEGLRETLRPRAAPLVAFLTMPATVGPHGAGACRSCGCSSSAGRFDAGGHRSTPPPRSRCYSIGLVAYTGVKVLAPAFYALGTPRVPLLASVCAVATNLVVIARPARPPRLSRHRAAAPRSARSLNAAVLMGVVPAARRRPACATRARLGSPADGVAAAAVMAPGGLAARARADGGARSGTPGLVAQLVDRARPRGRRGRRSTCGLAAHLPQVHEAPASCAGRRLRGLTLLAVGISRGTHKVLWPDGHSCYRSARRPAGGGRSGGPMMTRPEPGRWPPR